MTTEKRFTCNGALSMGDSHNDNLSDILSSMDGKEAYSSGVWKTRASVWEASSLTIDADDLAGPLEIRGSSPKSDRFNAVRGFFVDPSRLYEAVEFPRVSNADYLARDDGEVNARDLQLPMTNTETMAQRIAYRNLEQSNNQTIVNLTMNARGAKVDIGGVVTLDFPWLDWTIGADLLAKEDADYILLETGDFLLLESSTETLVARCIEWARNENGTYKVTLRKDRAASYTDPAIGDYGQTSTGGVTYPDEVTPPPSGLTATGVPAGVQLSWDNPPPGSYDFIEVYEGTSNDWTASPEQHSFVARITGETYTVPHDPGETYWYWIRAMRIPDLLSDREPDADITTITATSSDASGTAAGDVALISVHCNAGSGETTQQFRVHTDGTVDASTVDSGVYTNQYTWLNTGSNSDYDVKMVKVSGASLTSGTLDAWLNCGTIRAWVRTASTSSWTGQLSIRNANTGALLDSITVSLDNVTA